MLDPLRTLIVDDEPAALRRLSRLCEPLASVMVVGTANGAEEALHLLRRQTVDLLLLDIEMPGLSGLDLARQLVGRPNAPSIVFVTAFERFAIAAFGVDAVGYLLKPVPPDALADTIARVASRQARVPPREEPGFWVPDRGRLLRVALAEIDYISGEDDYVRLHAGSRSFLVADRLYAIEQGAMGATFLRIHRSTIVQRGKVGGLAHEGGGAWSIELASGVRLPIGRSFLTSVRSTLGLPR